MKAASSTRATAILPNNGRLAVTVSGSFRRHLHAINAAVEELASRGVRVLSPADPRIVAAQGEFLFVASDRVRSVKLVQDRHLDCIRASSFLWLICPDGYVGQSAALELGFAIASGIPIYATHAPDDLTLRQYVNVVVALGEALRRSESGTRPRQTEGLLIDPHASVEEVHSALERVKELLTHQQNRDSGDITNRVHREVLHIQTKLLFPALIQ
jgi:hypothetical protein